MEPRDLDDVILTGAPSRADVSVDLGPALPQSTETACTLAALVNAAYGYSRVSSGEMAHRARTARNRALHVARVDGKIVGCCSSTLYVPWCGPGCGHWGLLAVHPEAQGSGVASALVAHAEQRLALAGMSKCQVEYSFYQGDAQCERLMAWYEGQLGFRGPSSRSSGFRVCRKQIEPLGKLARWVCCEWFLAILRWLCCGQY
jgi:GNAT superfamily N-acetyltransferase